MVTKKEDCTRDKFSQKLDLKYGYNVKNCKDERERKMLVFLVYILSPNKPYNTTLTKRPPRMIFLSSRAWAFHNQFT